MIETDAIIKTLAKPAIEKSMPIFKHLKDKLSHALNDGMLDYFSASLDKYKEIKTLLHRQPTSFYNIYYPAKLYNKEKSIILSTESIKDLFNDGNFITILGDAGSGKSTLLKHLFISSFVEYYKAPIFVNLRDLNLSNSDLALYISENILDNNLAPSKNILDTLLKNGEFLFFLDGYDEINSFNKHQITSNLEKFIDKYPKNKFVLTSRPYTNIEFFKNFRNLHIKNLDKNDQIAFIEQQIIDRRLSNKIIDSLVEATEGNIDSFFVNPLLLTLYIMAYSKNSSIPNKKYIFYRRVFDVLYAEHDSATKIGFEREIKTGLSQESLEGVLQTFCFISFFDSNFDFKMDYISKLLSTIKDKTDYKFKNTDFIDDMKLSIGLWQEDCGVYGFAHRSMQEYFVATYLQNMKSLKNKEIIYNKIIEKTTERSFDIGNFISLCYEMDTSFFIEYFSIKMIDRIKSLILCGDGKWNLSFSYLSQGVNFRLQETTNENLSDSLLLSYSASKDIFLFIGVTITPDLRVSYINRIAVLLSKEISSPEFNKYFSIESDKLKQKNVTKSGTFSLIENINYDDFLHYLDSIGVITEFKAILNELEILKMEMKTVLENEKDKEDSFMAMI